MTAITKPNRSDLSKILDRKYLGRVPVKTSINTRAFRSLYWDEATCKKVDEVHAIVSQNQIYWFNPEVLVPVEVKHPLHSRPIKLNVEVSVQGRDFMWPRSQAMLNYRTGYDRQTAAEFQSNVTDMVRFAIDVGIFEEVANFAINECKTHEAARFLFPPYMALLRHDYNHIASKLEQVSGVPTLPKRPLMMQEKIRHAIQWFATQELLGTWEVGSPIRLEEGASVVTLSHAPTITLEHASGQTFKLPMRT